MRGSTVVLTIALIGSVATSSWLWLDVREARLQIQALRAQATHEFHQSTSAPSPAPASAPALAPASTTAEKPPQSTKAAVDAAPATRMDYGDQQRRLMKNPEYRKAFRNQQRVMIEFAFHDLPKVLGLTPEKANAVFDLMADQALQNMELRSRSAGDETDAQALRRDYEELQQKSDAQMEQLLGASGMEQLQDFRKSLTSRNEVNSLRNELASSTDPLREDQIEPLVDIVYAEQQRLDQDMREVPSQSFNSKRTELAVAANRRIVEAARSLLSSAQLQALDEFYRHQRQQMEAQSELSRLQIEAITQDAQARKAN